MLTHAYLCSGGSPASIPRTSSAMLIRQHTSAYVSIRQHTSAYIRIRQHQSADGAYVSGCSIRQRPHLFGNTASVKHHTLDMLGSQAMKHTLTSPALHCISSVTAVHTSEYVSTHEQMRHTSADAHFRRDVPSQGAPPAPSTL